MEDMTMTKIYMVEILNHSTDSDVNEVRYFTTRAKMNAYIKKMSAMYSILIYSITTITADE